MQASGTEVRSIGLDGRRVRKVGGSIRRFATHPFLTRLVEGFSVEERRKGSRLRENVLSDNLVSQIKQTHGQQNARWMEPQDS